jgi:hypothetical protein
MDEKTPKGSFGVLRFSRRRRFGILGYDVV